MGDCVYRLSVAHSFPKVKLIWHHPSGLFQLGTQNWVLATTVEAGGRGVRVSRRRGLPVTETFGPGKAYRPANGDESIYNFVKKSDSPFIVYFNYSKCIAECGIL